MFFRLPSNTTPTLKVESFDGRRNYTDRKMVLLACNSTRIKNSHH
jgi:hypothetical protein